ncbi:MAG: type II toxin-antitoxin system HicA family toxin [Chitinophagaceae bacterium]|nr:MAG: type II toxin-antitoxin system HicA family toxin [Chitinophagaceae bacterium]
MKIPRNLSAQDLVKALAIFGYQIDRQKGSHIRLTTSLNGQHHLTVPNHDPLKIGTLSAILSDVASHSGKTKEEVIEELFG